MKRIIRLTESDLTRIVRRVVKETFDLDSEKYGGKYHYQGEHGMDTIGPPTLHPNFEKAEWMREKLYELIDSGEYQEAAKLYKKIPVGGILPNEVRYYLESLGPHAFSSFEREL
jgi:hypothetical protein